MRPAAALTALTCVLLAGCGSSGGQDAKTPPAAHLSATIEQLWRAPGDDVAVVPGTSDYAPGRNRVSFLVVDSKSRLIERPSARVWIARDLKQAPYAQTTARLERIGVPGGDKVDVPALYVTHVAIPRPGKYWLLAEPVGGRKIQALGNLVVGKRSEAPAVGDRAIPSDTPTISSTHGDMKQLSTARRPQPALYRSSVKQALAAKVPFVVSFATPLYCQTRTCGPVVDVVDAVRKRSAGAGVRFIHVEIYKGNDPANGVNRWVTEWKLPTEPFTFVVDGNGVVRTKLEGAFSVEELERAVRAVAS
jgi:hypothetical protein